MSELLETLVFPLYQVHGIDAIKVNLANRLAAAQAPVTLWHVSDICKTHGFTADCYPKHPVIRKDNDLVAIVYDDGSVQFSEEAVAKTSEARANEVRRCQLAAEVYKALVDKTESFEHEKIGANIAYLLGAITSNGKFEVLVDKKREPIHNGHAEFIFLLNETFTTGHAVWNFVEEKYDHVETASEVMHSFAQRTGWDTHSELQLYSSFINEQGLVEEFAKFLADHEVEEDEWVDGEDAGE